MARGHRLALCLTALLALATIAVFVFGYAVIGDGGKRAVRVRGTLVDSTTGRPVSGAWVMALPNATWARDSEIIEMCRGEGDAWLPLCGNGFTERNGQFAFVSGVPYASVEGVFWKRQSGPTPQDIGALLVEVSGREPQVITIRSGQWTQEPASSSDGLVVIYATYDLGVVSVQAEAAAAD